MRRLPRPKAAAPELGPPPGKSVKILAIVDRHGLPLSVSTHPANHHEVTLVQLSFDFYMLEAKPQHLIGDRAYDGDGLDHDLKQDGVSLIAPHRSMRKLKTQDGRHLRRHQRRWLAERFFAWLQWKRRLPIRCMIEYRYPRLPPDHHAATRSFRHSRTLPLGKSWPGSMTASRTVSVLCPTAGCPLKTRTGHWPKRPTQSRRVRYGRACLTKRGSGITARSEPAPRKSIAWWLDRAIRHRQPVGKGSPWRA